MEQLRQKTVSFSTRSAWLLLGLLFQKPCISCGARVADPREAGLCPGCWHQLEQWPMPEVVPHLEEAPDFEPLAAFAYEGWLRELVHAWKFEGRSALTRPLARQMARRLRLLGADQFDAAVALPASRASMRERGFDAAGDLASAVSLQLGLPLLRPLRQVRTKQRQSGLKRQERLENVMGLYVARDGCEGKRLLIIDDLLSTGATAQAAAAALLEAGAVHVGVGVLAHAVAA